MFKLTLASFVNSALLHIIFVKFGSFTPPTENSTNIGIETDNFLVTMDYNQEQMYQIQIDTGDISRIPLTNSSSGLDIDINPLTKTLYWSDDLIKNSIMKAQVDGFYEEVFKTMPYGSTPEGIAVDYINQLLFYTCKFGPVIVVVSLKNRDIYKTIVNESLGIPNDIIVHPERGVIYWTDSGNETKIETSTMDGGNRSIIMSFEPYSMPNALAFDVKSMNLFWVDAYHGVIGRINIDTGVRKILYSDPVFYFIDMTLVGDKLYIIDQNHTDYDESYEIYVSSVSRLSLDGGELEQVGPSIFSKLTGITGYKKSDTRTVFSKCLQSTCSHLCLPVSGKDYKCACSDGYRNALNPCGEANVRKCLSDTDYRHIKWDTGIPGETSMHNCPTGYKGKVTRYCTKTGIYQDPVYNCTKTSIENIYNKLLDAKKTGRVNIIDVLDELSNETSDTDENSTLLIGDINIVVNTLAQIVDVVTVNTSNLENVTDSYIQTINNILDESTAHTWKVNINQTGSGADVVLKTTDRFVEKILTTSKNVTAEISKSNLYLKIASVQSCNEALNFPEHGKEGVSEWARSRKDGLVIDCDGTVESFSGIMYRNLSLIIPSSTNNTNITMSENLQLNAPVISFTFYPNIKRKLVSPVEIQFQLYNNSLDNARCSFWKESESETSQGYWSDEGCHLKKYDKDEEVVVCVCDHLTNFAVLMSPSTKPIEEEHKEALSIISMIGCIVSMICLVLNVAIHAFLWRFIKSVRYIIHMNLSCWLIVAYILFLAGINRTENKDVCTAMAVLLHLVFLIVFFGMLTEGCNLSYTVLKPLSTIKPGMPLMISSYVLAVIIVVISMGASQLQGYGTEQACWLSTDTGLIWAFLAPVLVVIVVNFIIVVLVIRTMCGTTAMSKKSNKGRAKAALRCILVLMPVMGLTWGFGALSLNSDTIVFQYIFALLNSFQGLLIFIFHCVMDKKIKDAFSKQRYKWLQSTQSFGVSEEKKSKTQDSSVF